MREKLLKNNQSEAVIAKAKHDALAIEACKNIPTPALEVGVVKKMYWYFTHFIELKKYNTENGSDNEESRQKGMDLYRCELEIIKLLEESK